MHGILAAAVATGTPLNSIKMMVNFTIPLPLD
jgi:hypothetical protein